MFYSYTLLASLLKISLSELLNLINAFGKSDALRTYDNVNSKFNDTNINSTKLLYEIAAEIADSGFTIEELLYVLGLNNNNPVFQISPDKIKSMLVELQQAFELIKQQNPSPVDSDITETLMSNKLLSLYEKDVTSQLIGMLNNNIVYAITLTDKPDLIIPDSLKYKIIYDKLSGRLQVFGVLTKDDKNIFSSEVNLDSALQPIWDKPFNFLKSNFSSFIVDDNTRNILLDRTGSTTSLFEKLKNLRDLYQPYLINQLGKRLVVEKISLLLSLNQSITGLITQSVIDNLYSSAVDIANEISTTTSYFPEQKVDDFTLQLTILNKSAFFISKFGLTINEIKYLLDHSADFYNMNFITFTVEHWQQINNYCFLRKLNRTPQLAFIDLFALASSGCSLETIVNYISLLTGWQKDEISSIITTYNYDVNSFKNPKVLRLMNGMFSVANKTSIKGSTLAQWAKYDTQFDSLTTLSSQIRDEIIQQFIPAERSDANSKINSTLLDNQRNALVDYILTLDDIKNYPITNVEELSGYFLTDLLMSSCMPVTRMVHAIAIVQSCFKRWLMGLEIVIDATTKKQVGVSPSQIDDAIWEAKSFFRTWQVSMEFLINPYPYLSYKYLIEKSDAAKTLEATLLKSDITQRTVEDAYRVYLQDMCDIANLEVVAMYIDDSVDVDGDPATKFIHVISKTRSAPYKYYYSTKNEAGRWSFLQNIPVAIRENDGEGSMPSGSHLIFTKFKDRYYLFMPEFIKRQDQDKTSQNTDSNFGAKNPEELSKIKIANISTSAPVLHEIKLGVSEFFQGKWSKKTYLSLSGDWSVFNNPMLNPPSDCIFNIAINKDSDGNDINLDINLYNNFYGILTMTFYSINSALILSKTPVSYSTGSGFYQNLNLNQSNLKIRIPEKDDMSMDVFNKAESGQFISYSPQFSNSMETIYDQPFFFYDINRCYYATAKPFTYIEEIPGQSYLKGVYDMPATISLLKKPKEAIFLPLHINQSKTWKL